MQPSLLPRLSTYYIGSSNRGVGGVMEWRGAAPHSGVVPQSQSCDLHSPFSTHWWTYKMLPVSQPFQHPSSNPQPLDCKQPLVLCRFVSDAVVKECVDFHQVKYVAISHVWGEAKWTKIKEFPDELIVSPSKARFLEKTLQKLVGTSYFWIDVFCFDQRGTEWRIKVTAVIPEIYNRAQKTVVIRDGLGYKSCCARALGDFSTWDEHSTGFQR